MDPLLLTLINISECISNYICYKMWNEITYPFPNINCEAIEVWYWMSNFTLHFIGHVITYPCPKQGQIISHIMNSWYTCLNKIVHVLELPCTVNFCCVGVFIGLEKEKTHWHFDITHHHGGHSFCFLHLNLRHHVWLGQWIEKWKT